MPDVLTIEDFLPRVGEVFAARLGEAEGVPMLLTELAQLPPPDAARFQARPFALVFHAAIAAGAGIHQQIYRMEHPGMEPFDCMLVPLGPDANGLRFEAVFT